MSEHRPSLYFLRPKSMGIGSWLKSGPGINECHPNS